MMYTFSEILLNNSVGAIFWEVLRFPVSFRVSFFRHLVCVESQVAADDRGHEEVGYALERRVHVVLADDEPRSDEEPYEDE